MSNRLTFSLASLILIFALAFVVMPGMAADGGPTVSITEYTGKNAADPSVNHVQTRADFRLKVTFSHLVTGFDADDVTVQTAASRTSLLSTVAGTPATVLGSTGAAGVPASELTNNKVFVIGLDLGDTAFAAGYLAVDIAANSATGAEGAVRNIGNQAGSFDTIRLPKANKWTLTPELDEDSVDADDDLDNDGNFLATASFTVNIVASNGPAGENFPTINASQIQVKDSKGMDVAGVTAAPDASYVANKLPVTITFSAVTDAPIFVGVNPNWAGTAGAPVRIPAATAPTPTTPKPTVTITLSEAPAETTDDTFSVRLAFSAAVTDLEDSNVMVMKEDPDDSTMKVAAEVPPVDLTQLGNGMTWIAEVDYQYEMASPLYVTVADSVVSAMTPTDGLEVETRPDPPGVPTGVTASVNQARNEITISWTAPTNDGGSPITGYHIGDAGSYYSAPADATSLTIGENPGTYTYSVRAINEIGAGDWSPAVTATVDAEAPGAPTAVTATAHQATDRITISWTAPTNDGGSDITGYIVHQFGQERVDYTTVAATETSFTTPALAAGDYSFAVSATNRVGRSDLSSPEAEATINADRQQPVDDMDAPPFFASDASIENIKIWAGHPYSTAVLPKASAAEGINFRYKVRKATASVGDPADMPDGFGLYANDIQDRTLQVYEANKADSVAMGKRTYEYIAYDTDNPMSESEPIEFTIEVVAQMRPTAPTMVTAAEEGLPANPIETRTINTNRVVVNWVAPVDGTLSTFSPPHNTIPFGSAITHYKVIQTGRTSEGNLDPGTPSAMYPADDSTTTTIGKDLTSYTTPELASRTERSDNLGVYEFQVIAVNGVGDSDPGPDEATDDSTALVLNPPNRPGDLRDAEAGTKPGSVALNWLPVTHEGDADGGVDDGLVTHYYITVIAPDGRRTQIKTANNNLERQVEGLRHGRYVFRVAGINSDGVGQESVSTEFDVEFPESPTNRAPKFAADATIDDIVATVGVRIVEILPEATDADGDNLDYEFSPDLPDGLDFNDDDLSIVGTPTTAMEETVYTYTVDDNEGGEASKRFTITVKAATEGPSARSTPTTSLPANGFIVYVRDEDNPPHFGTSNPLIEEWSDMPNLEALFSEGGGGSLQLTVAGVSARQVVFSEIMWAVDEGKIGQDSYYGNQWIELHNRTANAISTNDISFAVKADGRPALPQSTDLVSNVVGGGSDWIKKGKGQNGNSGAADGSGQVEFRSMHRKRFHNDSAGWNGGEWLEATEVYHPNHKGTPGRAEPESAKTFTTSTVALGTVFNEISNSSTGAHEWIEIRKRDGELSNLEKWVVHMVTGDSDRDVATNPTQTKLFQMPKLNDGRYGDTLLITRTDPARDDSHPLRGGYNVEVADADQANEGRDSNIRYYVADDWTTDLPDSGEFVLILRHGNDKTNHEKIQDIAGYHPNLKVERADFFSNLWPLINYPAPDIALNKIEVGKVHRRQKDNIAGTRTADKKDNADHVALRDVGWTGVGYKRNADAGAKNGGTPGYPNNALQSNETQAGADPVIISEIMYATGDRGNIPQWIELRNTSQTVGVNLDGWRITIVNHDQDSADASDAYPGDLVKQYTINGKIPPGQTFLVTAHSGTDNTNLPSERIVAIAKRRGDRILSQYGFEITVENKEKDGSREMADKVGNLAAGADARVRGNPQSYDEPAWMLPAGTNEDGDRISIVRASDARGLIDGLEQAAWKSFDMSSHLNAPESTYYGNRNDLSSPGYTIDSVLPVSLSKFRPVRLETGEVVVRWVTESETNNAGFNILRGEKLDGEFTKLNTKLIAGKGTTSEKTGYEFVDTSAKPNVVYYYQIQDVSLDGDVVTLKTTHLRGNISVVGKLTTTWGELKTLRE